MSPAEQPPSGVTASLAELACGVRYERLDEAVIDAARRAIVDTIGCMIAGQRTEVGAAVAGYAARLGTRRPPHSRTGLGLTGRPDAAALVHGTSAHALDFDDGLPGAVHPSGPVLAAILGMALIAPAPPLATRNLVEAFVAGWEAVARVTRALGPGHYRLGWHTTGTAGTLGATAAACRLAGHDADRTRMALGLAASLAGGLRRNFGSMTKPLHTGFAARNAVAAAELAGLGVDADPEILDDPGGFLDVFGSSDTDPDAIGAERRPALLNPGAIVKIYPCCYAAARGIDAMRQLCRDLDLTEETVESVTCSGPVGSFVALTHPRPRTGLEGKFSMPYALAATVLDGVPTLESFADGAVARPAARALMGRIQVREEARCRPDDPDGTKSSPATGGFVEVTATTTAGRSAKVRVSAARGSPDDPVSWGDVTEKFRACLASGGVATGDAEALLTQLRYGDLADVFAGVT